MIVGLSNPGAMGAAVGAAVVNGGHVVLWNSNGRSEATRERAAQAGLQEAADFADLAGRSEVVLSVCPPAAAEHVADEYIAAGFTGLYCEANAISPQRMRRMASRLSAAGAEVVDGSIIGGPPWQAGNETRLYLSGPQAATVAALFDGSPLHAVALGSEIGSASALKMAFAAWSKGGTALLAAILAVAEREGVRSQLERHWGEKFTAQAHRRVATDTAKAWRFAGEMEEIADTFAEAGLADGFHRAAAEIFRRQAGFKDAPVGAVEPVLEVLLGRSGFG